MFGDCDRSDAPDEPHGSAPAVLELGVELANQIIHGRPQYHARPGQRPGAAPAVASARLGGDTEIVRPLLVDPASASRIVLTGAVFDLPLPHLELRPSDAGTARYLVWPVVVVGEHDRPVPATLHLLGSPSMVVTVLELVPTRRLRWGRARFVRYGVEAIDTLARRIERAAA